MAKNQLSEEEIEIIRRAREVKNQASRMGVSVEEPETTKTLSAQSVSYDTFIPIVGLPSEGAFYKGAIAGQPLKVEDLLLIQSINEKTYYRVFSEIFSRRLKGIDPHDILVADEIYLALWLRANSYPGYNFPHDGFTCENPECQIEVPAGSVEFGFMDMEFESPNIDDIKKAFAGNNSTVVKLKSGIPVEITMRRRRHIARVESVLQRDFYGYGGTPSDELVQLLGIAAVVSFGDTVDIMETVSKIKNLSPVDFVDLLKHMKRLNIKAEPTIKLKCPACGEVTQFTGYVFRPEFYIPVDE